MVSQSGQITQSTRTTPRRRLDAAVDRRRRPDRPPVGLISHSPRSSGSRRKAIDIARGRRAGRYAAVATTERPAAAGRPSQRTTGR